MAYTDAATVAKQLGKPALAGPPVDDKLQWSIDMADEQIDNHCGRTEPFADPVPATIKIVALSCAIDNYKLADSTFGIVGAGETGPVWMPRDYMNRYDALLIPFYDPVNGWGVSA